MNEQAYEQIRKGTEGCRPGYKDCDLGKIPQRAPPFGGTPAKYGEELGTGRVSTAGPGV